MADSPENPYAAPADGFQQLRPRAGEGRPLEDPRSRGWLAIGLLWVQVANSAAGHWVGPLPDDPGRFPVEVPVRIGLLSATAATFLMWKFRCAKNAWTLSGGRMNRSPAMAVGGYFIPIYQLFGPCLAMREIVRITYDHSGRSSAEPFVVHWWLAFLGYHVLGVFTLGTPLAMVPMAVMAFAGILITIIIVTVSAAQAELHAPTPESFVIAAALPREDLPRFKSHGKPPTPGDPDKDE